MLRGAAQVAPRAEAASEALSGQPAAEPPSWALGTVVLRPGLFARRCCQAAMARPRLQAFAATRPPLLVL